MAKPVVTRTTNLLPFGDLDPKRFEDLVRALAYDFREWRSLEATGRAGSDRGYDARAFEKVDDSSDLLDEDSQPKIKERLWLIQCKREKSIGAEKAKSHLKDLNIKDDDVYGMIFAASCDFSIMTRDVIREWARDNGLSEIHIWGKGELEDQLRQPKNDYLLFAFFGISFQIRKRSMQSELRSILSIKRKCQRLLKEHKNQYVLLRDYSDKRYPLPKEDDPDQSQWRWGAFKYTEMIHAGLVLSLREYFAYIADDQESWDMIEVDNLAAPFPNDNYWHFETGGRERGTGSNHWDIWNKLPYHNKASYHIDRIVPFRSIIDVDEIGDQYAKFPHVYVENMEDSKKITYLASGGSYDRRSFPLNPDKRIDYFSKLIAEKEADLKKEPQQ